MSILTTVLAGAGRQFIDGLSEGRSPNTNLRTAEQLSRFEDRLDHVMDPERAGFKQYLSEHLISTVDSAEFARERLENQLLNHPDVSRFLAGAGTSPDQVELVKSDFGYLLQTPNGQNFRLTNGSQLEEVASHLCRIESVLQLAALNPGMGFDQLVEYSFKQDQQLLQRQTQSTS